MRFQWLAVLIALASLLVAVPAKGQEQVNGQFDSGAYYQIQVPPDWQPEDGLVLWNHGFDLNPPAPMPGLGPLAELQLSQGYAVAATSYRLNGWALFRTIGDLRDLVHEFERRFGRAEKIYLTGGSMGGLVSIQGLEAAGLGNVVGVYSLCGALGGGRLWDAALDLRLAYDAVCEGVKDAGIDGGAKGLPFRIDPEDYRNEDWAEALAFLLGDRINACTGVPEPQNRSSAQQARLDQLMAVLGLPNEAFFLTVMGFATAGLADLVYDPAKLDGTVGTSNVGVDYGDAGLNADIARVNAKPLPRLHLLQNYRPTGQTGDARVLAIHTDEDGLVPVESLSAYGAVSPDDRYAYAVVDEAAPSHCGFTPAEAVAGWQALTAWVEQGVPEPDTSSLQAGCKRLAAQGVEGPCRYAPGFEVASLDTVIPPRDEPDFNAEGRVYGAFYAPGRSGEGWFIEDLDQDRALVYWFTYPPQGAAGEQLWLIGTGTVQGNTLQATLYQPSGRVFGEPAPVTLSPWGKITFNFANENQALVRWVGLPAFGSGQRKIQELAGLLERQSPIDLDPPYPSRHRSGSWYDTDWVGEGWQVMNLGDFTSLVYWFTYDAGGHPAWLMGVGERGPNYIQVDKLVITGGASFGTSFESKDVTSRDWGSLRIQFTGCNAGQASFDTLLPGFNSGERSLTRLTVPFGGPCPY